MAEGVYILCMLTSLACAAMLLRAYRRRRTALLLWSSLCFVGQFINNLLLVVDLILIDSIDFSMWRTWSMFLSVALLVFGFVWDGRAVAGGARERS